MATRQAELVNEIDFYRENIKRVESMLSAWKRCLNWAIADLADETSIRSTAQHLGITRAAVQQRIDSVRPESRHDG